jgi:hypothetical protein
LKDQHSYPDIPTPENQEYIEYAVLINVPLHSKLIVCLSQGFYTYY